MKIYTRRGDKGETGLFGGGRVPKAHRRVEAYGAVDELNSVLGWALGQVEDAGVRERLTGLQHDLFAVGAHLATPPPDPGRTGPSTPPVPESRVEVMEGWIDAADEVLPELRHFILPGGSPGAAALHVSRTVCRRAERRVVELAGVEVVHDGVLKYLNRLSDLLFALARLENARAGRDDVIWRPPGEEGDGPPP